MTAEPRPGRVERQGLHDLLTACHAFRTFFLRHNISMEGVRLVIHVPDTRTQWAFDCAVQSEMPKYLVFTGRTMPPNTYEFVGVPVSVVNPEEFDRP